MDIHVTVHVGSQALALLRDAHFMSAWTRLAQSDTKACTMQQSAFVTTWYRRYHAQYQPVLCVGHLGANDIIGIMPLAYHASNNSLTHAGGVQAEYHGWIAAPEFDEVFPVACLIELRKHLNLRKWEWRWLPPRTPVSWLSSQGLRKHGIYAVLRRTRSPLWDLTDADRVNRLLKNKSLRLKYNYYKKKGAFTLERITDKSLAWPLLELLSMQCDFRQAAINGVTPFADDPAKLHFYHDKLDNPQTAHFTVLRSNDKPIAFHFGDCDNNTVYLGLSAFDPLEGKHSPGTLLYIELGIMLKQEGFEHFDLTPGGDEYKEMFANARQSLVQPTFYFSRQEMLNARVRQKVRRIGSALLSKCGFQAAQVKTRLRRIISQPLRDIIAKGVNVMVGAVYVKGSHIYYRLNCDSWNASAAQDPDIRVQAYGTLLLLPANSWINRQKMLSDALKRMSSGDIFYSIVKNGSLVHYGWVTRRQVHNPFKQFPDVRLEIPQRSMLLYEFFTIPHFRRQGLYERNLRQMITDSIIAGATEIYIGADEDNVPSRRAIEKVGFTLFRTYRYTRCLFFCRKSTT